MLFSNRLLFARPGMTLGDFQCYLQLCVAEFSECDLRLREAERRRVAMTRSAGAVHSAAATAAAAVVPLKAIDVARFKCDRVWGFHTSFTSMQQRTEQNLPPYDVLISAFGFNVRATVNQKRCPPSRDAPARSKIVFLLQFIASEIPRVYVRSLLWMAGCKQKDVDGQSD